MTPRSGFWWALSATFTALGAAAWLRQPSTGALIGSVVAAVCSIALAWRGRHEWNRPAFAVCAAVFVVVAVRAQHANNAYVRTPAVAGADLSERATAAMAAAIAVEAAELQRLALGALDAPAEPAAAFAHLDGLRGQSRSRSVVLTRGGREPPVAWSGRVMAPLDSFPGPVGAVGTPFYLVIYAIAGRGSDRARAETLVHAVRPANSIMTAFDTPLARRFGVDGFAFVDPSGAVSDSFTVVHAAGLPLLGVRALAPTGGVLAARALERGRTRGGLALAFALAFFVAAVWRQADGVGSRLVPLAVALAVVALVPLSDYSNVSPLFDPALFYVDAGGPFTGSVGALAITCAIVLLGMLAALRARLRAVTRAQALLAVVGIAGVGPFLLGSFARGIQFPATGATVAMWLGWEVTLFLAAVSVLLAGVTAGQAALGARRGLPRWLAPAIAAAAALLAPAVMNAPGVYPQWYPALWVVAIAALAFARSARGAVLPVAVVAACGAVALVWGQSVRARVGLAERDIASLNVSDPAAAALLRRFSAQLDVASAPQSRPELLLRYAASDLASGDYPVELTSWDPLGRIIADLRVGLGPGKAAGIDFLAREAIGAVQPILRETLGEPGLYLVLAFPHVDHSVTTVVVAPRTRLLQPDPFGALIGLGAPPTTDPPYSLTLNPAGMGAYISSALQWVKRGTELHGDLFLSGVGGRVSNVHATVELRAYEALGTRGALVVFLDLGALALLWLLLVIADGAFGRWMRMRRRRWLGSYRARLTVVLFAFFVLPAAAFAAWSYRRLQSDDSQARDLLVWETLRGVTAASDTVQLPALAERFGTPLLLYANGVLVGTSDPLYDVLAPVGRLIPASAERTIAEGDQVTASAEERVGNTPMRFGFRTVSVTADTRFVLAAPARTSDLALDRRRRDLGILVLFATAVGALAALWLSELAARQLSRPIRALQSGALALAAGEREPRLEGEPPVEFRPVFSAFRQMAHDLAEGREQEARAQRVLAWGEMARQVAHEIKNPLTPMRLGMQHLRRARHDPRVDFERVLDENVARVLAEIDRLDEIARAFSRYGTAPDERTPAEPVDVAQAVQGVVHLEELGGPDVEWHAEGAGAPLFALANDTELREVLLNLLENARHASPKRVHVVVSREDGMVSISVKDDGHGIPLSVLPRIFEPHFSTRTSGSGLGLAITRRMIESWGGTIAVESVSDERVPTGTGTIVRIALVPADAPRQL